MPKTKVAVTLEEEVLGRLDRLVEDRVFASRSAGIQKAVEEKLARLEKGRLARECARLDPAKEKAMAEEGMSEDVSQWPEY